MHSYADACARERLSPKDYTRLRKASNWLIASSLPKWNWYRDQNVLGHFTVDEIKGMFVSWTLGLLDQGSTYDEALREATREVTTFVRHETLHAQDVVDTAAPFVTEQPIVHSEPTDGSAMLALSIEKLATIPSEQEIVQMLKAGMTFAEIDRARGVDNAVSSNSASVAYRLRKKAVEAGVVPADWIHKT